MAKTPNQHRSTALRPASRILLCLAVCFAALCPPAWAQSSRAGFVDLERLLKEVQSAKSAQEKLRQEFAQREKEVIDLGRAVRSNSEKFEREAPSLMAAERSKRQQSLLEQEQNFQLKQRQFETDLNVRKNEEVQKVLEAANQAIRKVAQQEGIDLVLQEAVYINPNLDITEKVIRILNTK